MPPPPRGPECRTLAQSPSDAFRRGPPPAFPASGSAPHEPGAQGLGLVMPTLRAGPDEHLPSPAERPHLYSAHLCPARAREIPAFPPKQADPCSHTLLKGERNESQPQPQPSETQGRALLEPTLPLSLPPSRGPWCMVQSMQFLCLFCFLFSQWEGWGGSRVGTGRRERGPHAGVIEKATC